MKITHENMPWPHHTIHNFFSDDEYKKVYDYMMSLPIYEEGHMLFEFEPTNQYPEPKVITRISNGGPFITKVVSIFDETINEIFDRRFKELLDELQIDWTKESRFFQHKLSIQAPNTGWNLIHEDLPPKVYNLMIHISETGVGTVLYTNRTPESYVKKTEWIPNGGQGWDIFYDSGYWHDVTNLDNDRYRYVIRLMLIDSELKRPSVNEY